MCCKVEINMFPLLLLLLLLQQSFEIKIIQNNKYRDIKLRFIADCRVFCELLGIGNMPKHVLSSIIR